MVNKTPRSLNSGFVLWGWGEEKRRRERENSYLIFIAPNQRFIDCDNSFIVLGEGGCFRFIETDLLSFGSKIICNSLPVGRLDLSSC